MRFFLALAATVAALGLSATGAWSQTRSGEALVNRGSVPAPPRLITGQSKRYVLADVCSITGGINNSCVTLVHITNLDDRTCRVGAEFRYPNITGPVCTVTYGALPKGNRITICTRAQGDIAFCDVTCNAPLINVMGWGIVYSNCDKIAVQATVYTKNSADTAITSAHSVKIIPWVTPPATQANQGD